MRRAFSLQMILTLGLIGCTSTPEVSPTATVKSLLNSYHPQTTASAWQQLGPATAEQLRKIYLEPRTPRIQQLRALYALRFYSDPNTDSFLGTLSEDKSAPLLSRRQAIESLVALNGIGELPRLQRLLEDPQWRLRLTVLKELQRLRQPAAKTLYGQQLHRETSPELLRRLR